MKKTTVVFRILSLLCIVLILSVSLAPFISHGHEEHAFDCAFCYLMDISHSLFDSAIAICAVLLVTLLFLQTHSHPFSIKDRTPVGQRVKLSN